MLIPSCTCVSSVDMHWCLLSPSNSGREDVMGYIRVSSVLRPDITFQAIHMHCIIDLLICMIEYDKTGCICRGSSTGQSITLITDYTGIEFMSIVFSHHSTAIVMKKCTAYGVITTHSEMEATYENPQ